MVNWLIKLNTVEQPKCRLFCFPFSGGGTVNYMKWLPNLDPRIEVFAFNLPGRERYFSEPVETDFKYVINNMTESILPFCEVPIVFFGHSFGGLSSFFTSLNFFEKHQITPNHLYISARIPPIEKGFERLSLLEPKLFLDKVVEKYQGIPEQIKENASLMQLFLPIIRSDFLLYEQFPQVYETFTTKKVSCPLTTFRFTEDSPSKADFDLWEKYTENKHQHIDLPGGHFELLKDWSKITQTINQNL